MLGGRSPGARSASAATAGIAAAIVAIASVRTKDVRRRARVGTGAFCDGMGGNSPVALTGRTGHAEGPLMIPQPQGFCQRPPHFKQKGLRGMGGIPGRNRGSTIFDLQIPCTVGRSMLESKVP